MDRRLPTVTLRLHTCIRLRSMGTGILLWTAVICRPGIMATTPEGAATGAGGRCEGEPLYPVRVGLPEIYTQENVMRGALMKILPALLGAVFWPAARSSPWPPRRPPIIPTGRPTITILAGTITILSLTMEAIPTTLPTGGPHLFRRLRLLLLSTSRSGTPTSLLRPHNQFRRSFPGRSISISTNPSLRPDAEKTLKENLAVVQAEPGQEGRDPGKLRPEGIGRVQSCLGPE